MPRTPRTTPPDPVLTLALPPRLYAALTAAAAANSRSIKAEVVSALTEAAYWRTLREKGDRITITPRDPTDPPYDLRVINLL